ncbi:MAG: MerR family transcriptional regulator [Candidatus Omnitrophica bacterium]|nr:MerR family transcriptional regulator [Candidatus Omnitrophota bacterium]
MNKTLISPIEISKKYNISYQTINYYTNLGLLKVRRREGNNRLYNNREVRSGLSRITKLKSQGYSLHLIRGIVMKEQ